MKPTSDTPVDGTLFIFTQNVALVEGASLDGSVVILGCNLIMEADVSGNVILRDEYLSITTSADVAGNVTISTGNVFKQ